MGRCLIHILLKRRDLAPTYVPPVSLMLGANKDAYIAGLENFRADRVDRWVEQFSQAVEIAPRRTKAFSADVTTLQERWREQAGILTRHRNQRKGDSREAEALFSLLDKFEPAVKLP